MKLLFNLVHADIDLLYYFVYCVCAVLIDCGAVSTFQE